MSHPYLLYALHGFLGLMKDWDELLPEAKKIDLFAIGKPSSQVGLKEWGNIFNQEIDHSEKQKVLIGYSLGGRLALHALLQEPHRWNAAVIISAHPGLESEIEKVQRNVEDAKWAKRFESDQWSSLMLAWNSQNLFGGGNSQFKREEKDYQRFTVAAALKYWSLSSQENLKPYLTKLNLPIFWIAGELDYRYAEIARNITFSHPKSQIWIAPNSNHRIPWEIPDLFKQKINQFLGNI